MNEQASFNNKVVGRDKDSRELNKGRRSHPHPAPASAMVNASLPSPVK